MIGNLLRLPEEDLQQILDDPETAGALLFPEDEANVPDEQHLRIERVWHILHYLLTGTAWEGNGPSAKVILGGTQLGDGDLGYGPAHYLSVAEVRDIAGALNRLSGEQLWERVDLEEMSDARLYAFQVSEVESMKEHAIEYFERVKAFYRRAADDGHTVVKFLS